MRKVVVFPAPLGPRSPKISPRLTSNEVSATATKFPNLRAMPSARMTTGRSAVSSADAAEAAEVSETSDGGLARRFAVLGARGKVRSA